MPFNLLKGLVEEVRVQAHLGAMDLKARARPWLDRADTAAHELVKRGLEWKQKR